jgi:glycosyltransferase involved in cell wall biosynthesis
LETLSQIQTMAKICLLSHGQPSSNPRLVRDANALSNAGHEVIVITPRFVASWISYDEDLVRHAKWHYHYLDFLKTSLQKVQWRWIRLRRKLSCTLAQYIKQDWVTGYASDYANSELANLAVQYQADLYVAHQQQSLPAAVWAAQKTNSKFAVDIHDLLADCPSAATHLIQQIEEGYLANCSYISTMSSSAAQHIQTSRILDECPIVLHNTPSLTERQDLESPDLRPQSEILTLYWFGQTIGYHSRADQVIRAMPLLHKPVKLVLRGHPHPAYVSELEALAHQLGVSHALEIAPIASPREMVSLAAQYDILLGTQPGDDLFHQMAIGNKVFTGMMAGLALGLTDTIAYRQLLAEAPGCGFLFPDQDEKALAEQLNRLLDHPELLSSMKRKAWDLAEASFNFEKESQRLIEKVGAIVTKSEPELSRSLK